MTSRRTTATPRALVIGGLITLVALWGAILLILFPSLITAQDPPAESTARSELGNPPPDFQTIAVSGTGHAALQPDAWIIHAIISTTEPFAVKARGEAETAANQLHQALKAQGIHDRQIRRSLFVVATGSELPPDPTVAPTPTPTPRPTALPGEILQPLPTPDLTHVSNEVRNRPPARPAWLQTGYTAYLHIAVTLEEEPLAYRTADFIQRTAQHNVFINAIYPAVFDPDAARRDAANRAIANALQKAQTMASALGLQLDEPIQLVLDHTSPDQYDGYPTHPSDSHRRSLNTGLSGVAGKPNISTSAEPTPPPPFLDELPQPAHSTATATITWIATQPSPEFPAPTAVPSDD